MSRKIRQSRLFLLLASTLILCFCLAAGYPALVDALELELTSWKYNKELILQGSQSYKYFYLDEDIYREANSSLSDLRLVDKDQFFVPYYLQNTYEDMEWQVQEYTSRLVGTATKNHTSSFDFEVQSIPKNEDIRADTLVLGLQSSEFLKHIEIYGSYDGHQWEYIKNDTIYQTAQFKKLEIDLGQVYKYTFYRVALLHNVEAYTLDSLILNRNDLKWESKKYERQKKAPFTHVVEGKRSMITIPNPDRLRIVGIELKIPGVFQRSYRVIANENDPIATQENEIYQLSFKEAQVTHSKINFYQPVQSEKLTLSIDNQDNRPLQIESVEILFSLDKLVFEDSGSGPYLLYYGNPEALQPVYEIQGWKKHIEKEEQDLVKLGPASLVHNQAAASKPYWLQQQFLLNGAIILASLILLFVLTRAISAKKG